MVNTNEIEYINYFEKFGISQEEADKRCQEIFNTIFYGSEEESFYHPAGIDMGYMEDTGNHDARTEGMSYGMMMCVQTDHQEEFNRLWKWARTYMYLDEGPNKGYFAWSCQTDGKKNSYGAAPDGEEFFIMALIFAGNRWGNGQGIFDYHTEAKNLLHTCINKGYDGTEGRAMFDRETGYIKFITDVDFSDPSYHLPHFYELYSQVAEGEDKEFCKKAAKASREYWKKACNEVTGFSSEYAEYDGSPHHADYEVYGGRHDWYFSDAYRTILNIALDSIWFGLSDWAKEEGEKLAAFFQRPENLNDWNHIYEVDGRKLEEPALHPVAIIATNACTGVLAQNDATDRWVKLFLETPLRLGDRRYYDNCLYFFSYMILSGNYKVY
ncbi:MAG: xylanase [Eubacterium sp.]|nr:xylanase [Eubacterium sp.]